MNGHVRKRGRNWSVVVDVWCAENGKRKQKWISGFKTKKEAEKELARVLNDIVDGTYVEPSKVTVSEYLRRWLEDSVKIDVTQATYEQYKRVVENHLIPALGRYPLAKLQPVDIQDFLNRIYCKGRLDGKGGLCAGSVQHHHYVLKKALKQAVRLHFLSSNPADATEPPRIFRKEMKVLDEHQMAHLLEFCKGRTMFYMPIMVAIYTGMRKGEIIALRWKDVDFDRTQIHVRQAVQAVSGGLVFKEPKTQKGRRIIDLPSLAVDELRCHKVEQAKNKLRLGPAYQDYDLVCAKPNGQPMHPICVSDGFSRWLKKAKLPHVRFHDLRHSHATQLLKQGINIKVISERLGHANIGITLEVYSHVLPSMQREAADSIDIALRSAMRDYNRK